MGEYWWEKTILKKKKFIIAQTASSQWQSSSLVDLIERMWKKETKKQVGIFSDLIHRNSQSEPQPAQSAFFLSDTGEQFVVRWIIVAVHFPLPICSGLGQI